VFEKVREAGSDGENLVEAFVMTMVWGFGRWPVGPYRTSVMVESGGPRFGELLCEVVNLLQDGDEGSRQRAYRSLLTIEQCGPAFATKFMYFVSPLEHRIPIFDNVVASWLTDRGVKLFANRRKDFYGYHEFCEKASRKTGEQDLGLLEYAMFSDQQVANIKRSISGLPNWLIKQHFSYESDSHGQ
jgi:hypothetical protein